ncbi:C-C motif chemokine 19b [Conger conger]|uniref:C-C motif chemokine 19b n=1 Tax=Conger conger TaxID=82655 RepID=UPI002A59D13C|nr:C-C motif chemokine 19b [Conger conger]
MDKSRGATSALRAPALLLLVLVLCSYATANTDEVLDCCLSTKNKSIAHQRLKGYSIQTETGGCRIPATIFITKMDLRLCAPPARSQKWVAKLIKKLDRKRKPKRKRGRKN